MAVNYQEGDLIICTVKDIVKTTVFVETEEKVKGSIVFSEVAPGRIRNIRDYVVPNKIIVCKILDVRENHLFLSLRRVKDKEKKELIEAYKKQKNIESIIKKLLGIKAEETINEIKNNEGFEKLFNASEESTILMKKYFSKEEIEKINKIITQKKEKEREIKKEFLLNSKQPDGIIRIKKILSTYKEIYYLGGSRFVIKIKSLDLKQANSEINQVLEFVEKNAKKEKCEFSLIKK